MEKLFHRIEGRIVPMVQASDNKLIQCIILIIIVLIIIIIFLVSIIK